MKKLLDILTRTSLLAFFPLAFFPLAFFPLAFLLLSGCGEIINVYTTSAERPALELEVGSGGEWTEAIAFTAILAEATTKNVTFSYATKLDGTADEEDLVSVTGKATILAGETEVSVIVQIIDDYQDDNDETFSFVLSKANTELINGEDSITATATILDDDYSYTPIRLVQFDDVSIKEGDGYTVNRATFDIILNRSVLAHENVSFDYIVIGETAQVNEDYISIQGTADISLTDRISLSVEIVGDYVAEDRFETFRLVLSNPVGSEIVESDDLPEVDGIAVGTIIDNDKLVIESFRNVFRVEGDANHDFTFDVVFSRPVLAGEVVSLKYTVIQGTAKVGSDYVAVPATTLYFDDSSDGGTIVVEIIGDDDDEDDYETFTVELSELVGISTIPEVDLIAKGTIQDDDGAQGLLKDVDGDGLIDIYDAYMLDKIRYDLAGTSYKTSASATGITRGCPSSGCFGYELVENILLPPTNWVPVGSASIPFKATFEGNGFSIDNLNIAGSNDLDDIGFFGALDRPAELQNFNLAGSITGKYHKGEGLEASKKNVSYIGSIAGSTRHRILINNVSSNVPINISVKECSNVGGLVGYGRGTIQNSSATGNITGRAYFSCLAFKKSRAGGLAGFNLGSIENSHATGKVFFSGKKSPVGGLVGENYGTISNSSATGRVFSSGSSYIGGLVGESFGFIRDSRTGDIANGIKAGNVGSVGPSDIGGLVGRNSGHVINSYATGDVYGPTRRYRPSNLLTFYVRSGGLVGINSAPITDSYATGNVYGSSYLDQIGGLVGRNSNYALIRGNYATGNVYGDKEHDFVGGLVGFIFSGKMEGNYATGNVYGGEKMDLVGGLAGFIENGRVEDNYATGTVYGGEGPDRVGGLLGGSDSGSISNSYATGAVNGNEGNDWVGGLMGFSLNGLNYNFISGNVYRNPYCNVYDPKRNNSGGIRNSYATGAVNGNEGNDWVGGLAGLICTGVLKNSYAIGAVDGGDGTDDKIGSLVGDKGTSADIAGNYYLMGSGLTNGTALSLATTEARGKSKANLKALTIAITGNDFTEGWSNFDWNLTDNDKYPSLKSYKAENGTQVEGAILCGQSSEHVQC